METAQGSVRTGPLPALLDWLEGNEVEFTIHEHPVTYTARETARAEHVSPERYAKAVGVVTDDGRRSIIVVEAKDHVDFGLARTALGASHVRLMTETELAAACPHCEVGATPPVGAIFGLPTFVDFGLKDDQEITFAAGTHSHAIRLARVAWEQALNPMYARLAEQRDTEPAWMRS